MNTPKAKETPTPRTDEARYNGFVSSYFARTLERELAEAKAGWTNCAGLLDTEKERSRNLREQNAALQARVERLEGGA
jgi:hypothetical protein